MMERFSLGIWGVDLSSCGRELGLVADEFNGRQKRENTSAQCPPPQHLGPPPRRPLPDAHFPPMSLFRAGTAHLFSLNGLRLPLWTRATSASLGTFPL